MITLRASVDVALARCDADTDPMSLVGSAREAVAVSALVDALRPLVDSRLVPGFVAAVGRGDQLDVVVLGASAEDGRPMAQDALFRIASITKPMMAALVLTFVAEGVLELDQPVGELLPELAAPAVVRSMTGPVDDTVPASRPITLRHLLTSTNGHGFPSDFSAPVAQLLVERLLQGPPQPQLVPPPDEWMTILGRIPLLHQPARASRTTPPSTSSACSPPAPAPRRCPS
jgi:CubicO group peptidase (beta-lactamase class C family)